MAGSGWATYLFAIRAQFASLAETAHARMALLVVALDATIERFHYLPTVLSQAEPIQAVYGNPTPATTEAANAYLKDLGGTAGAAALFVADANGVTLATSNYLGPDSFYGRNYAFRPYVREALAKPEGRYYAVGATTGKPGYFLWHSVADAAGRTLGVAVVKVDLLALQDDWTDAGSSVAIVDGNGLIFLTDRPEWRYRAVQALGAGQLRSLRDSRQYGRDVDYVNPLFRGAYVERGQRVVRVAGDGGMREYVVFSRPLPAHGWTMSLLFEVGPQRTQAMILAAAVMLALVAGMLIYLVTHQRRQVLRTRLEAHEALERRVQERTAELAAANERLHAEIRERIRAQEDLSRTQENLVHASKMASLGTALAGVAHEINQSLAALTTYVAGARVLLERGLHERVLANLDRMATIVGRMGALTRHLKSFARKDTGLKQATDFGAATRAAIALLDHRLADDGLEVVVDVPDAPLYVTGNAVRLEQVVVNLVSNALDAMAGLPERRLTVRLGGTNATARLTVADTGSGIPEDSIPLVFDPFYTTKDVGQGLGLGLSISYGIIRDMGGEIGVRSVPGAGTTFTVSLPRSAVGLRGRREETA